MSQSTAGYRLREAIKLPAPATAVSFGATGTLSVGSGEFCLSRMFICDELTSVNSGRFCAFVQLPYDTSVESHPAAWRRGVLNSVVKTT